LTFVSPTPGLIALAVGWALFTPILVTLSLRFDGFVSRLDAATEVSHA
jgi:hypothetical protein